MLPDQKACDSGLTPSGKSVLYGAPGCLSGVFAMSDPTSELVEISKLNGDFKKNYGTFLGAYLYLRSISAARGRPYFWSGLLFTAVSTALIWLKRNGLFW
jgi:hypothetical protein